MLNYLDPYYKFFVQKFFWMIVLGVLLGFAPQISANPKKADLEQKIADISLLRHQLSDRIEQAKVIREKFRHQKQSLIDEINLLRQTRSFDRFEEADQYPRIHYNILLIADVESYLSEIDSKINFYQTGQDKLAYLQKSASDDIKMIETLNDLEIDALTTQISLVIHQYLAEAHTIQLNPNVIKISQPNRIWDSIFKSK